MSSSASVPTDFIFADFVAILAGDKFLAISPLLCQKKYFMDKISAPLQLS
jgi:hypothetical protein